MKVRDVMTIEVISVEPGESVKEAARKMMVFDIGMLPVYDGTRVAGIVTDRDICIRAAAHGLDPAATPVSRVMTSGAVFCRENTGLQDAVKMMEEKQIRRILVNDSQGALSGVVSLGDIAARGGKRYACEAFDRIVEST